MTDRNSSKAPAPLVILTTQRLVLRATTEADIAVMHERVFGDADVMSHVFLGNVMTRERAESFMREHFTFGAKRTGIAILTEKSNSNVIGFAGLFPCKALDADDLEIGFVMAKQAWGKGYATEIGMAQLAMGFDELGCQRLLGLVEPRNAASIHALTKLGMRFLKDVISTIRPPRSVYAMLSDEWRNRPSSRMAIRE